MQRKIVTLMAVQPPQRDPQWLKDSLQAAVELELSTLPPYLCGMWSIHDATVSPGLDVYRLIDSVVREEMTHMGLVCNLLTAIPTFQPAPRMAPFGIRATPRLWRKRRMPGRFRETS